MKEPLTCCVLSGANPTMLRPYGAARVVMSWRRNRAAIELKVDRTKNARGALMISFSWATLPRSRCKSRSSTRGAPARRHLSGCAPARGLLPRRNDGTRRRGGRPCNRFRHHGSRGRAGTAENGKRARSRKSRNRPARPPPGRRSTDRDIFAMWARARCVLARRFPFSFRPRASGDFLLTFPWRGKVDARSAAGWGESARSALRIPASPRTPPRVPSGRDPPPPGEGEGDRSRDASAPEFCSKNESPQRFASK
jgi:hypothetical protein